MKHPIILPLSLLALVSLGAAASDDSDGQLSGAGPLLDTIRTPKTDILRPKTDIRIDADMTLVPVTVTDEHGRNVRGLERQNFRILDGKEIRPIVAFSREDAPVSVVLVFDASRSMRDKFKAARDAASHLFQQLNPDDEVSLITVSDRAVLRRDWTSNLGEVADALVFAGPDGTTSLVDGIYLGLEQMKKARNPRKALVVVSDGGDNNSRYTMRELIDKAIEADAMIYTVCLYQNPQTPEELGGPELLEDLAGKTGGISFLSKQLNDFGNIMGAIGVTLHNQYVLGYYPPNDVPSGKYRKIKVELLVPQGMPPLNVYARSGYYTPQR
jgi:Ca-activated chloride channel homolog